MFEARDRESLTRAILERAEADSTITACALVGSAARGDSDPWSDIDVALQVSDATTPDGAAGDWTAWLETATDVADTLDLRASGALYRVFLLDSSMQVDLSFWPSGSLRSTGQPIRALFGELQAPMVPPAADPGHHIKLGWLYALHARSAVARGRAWQADMMMSSLREEVMALTCLRLGLDPTQGRQTHRVPEQESSALSAARPRSMQAQEQQRCLAELLGLLGDEAARHDPELAHALAKPLQAMGH